MAEEKVIRLTYEGKKKMEDELSDLKANRRREIAQKIKEAREQGDLSENAEYDAARDEQREIERRISQLDEILRNAVVVEEDTENKETVSFGSRVVIRDMEEPFTEYNFKIVGSAESDLMNGKISDESPVGKKLIGSMAGQVITVDTPSGKKVSYEVVSFERN